MEQLPFTPLPSYCITVTFASYWRFPCNIQYTCSIMRINPNHNFKRSAQQVSTYSCYHEISPFLLYHSPLGQTISPLQYNLIFLAPNLSSIIYFDLVVGKETLKYHLKWFPGVLFNIMKVWPLHSLGLKLVVCMYSCVCCFKLSVCPSIYLSCQIFEIFRTSDSPVLAV